MLEKIDCVTSLSTQLLVPFGLVRFRHHLNASVNTYRLGNMTLSGLFLAAWNALPTEVVCAQCMNAFLSDSHLVNISI